jgi:hypothetical protein
MMWQAFIVMPVAILPLCLWTEVAMRRLRCPRRRKLGLVYVAVTLVVVLAMAFGSPQYRRGGRLAITAPLDPGDPMARALGIDRCCVLAPAPEERTDPGL